MRALVRAALLCARDLQHQRWAEAVVVGTMPTGGQQQQQQQWGSQRRGGSGGGPSLPCLFHHRGHCRQGEACRFSHAAPEETRGTLPLQHRALVVAEGAPQRGTTTPPGAWRVRCMSYNVLADCLAREHAAELYSSPPRYALEWGYRAALIVR